MKNKLKEFGPGDTNLDVSATTAQSWSESANNLLRGGDKSTQKSTEQVVELDSLREGGPEALDHFYRTYSTRVLAWAIRLAGPYLDPQDIAQDVFAIALSRLSSFQGRASLNTWLFGITRHVIHNARRKARWRKWLPFSEIFEPRDKGRLPDEMASRSELRLRVQKALERVPMAQREVLVLIDLEERTAGEAAKMLRIPVGTAYSRLHHARKNFATALGREGLEHISVVTGGRGRKR